MKKILVVLIGLAFVGVGIFILVNGNAKIKRCTEKTIGTVVDIKEEWTTDSDGDDTYKYYPVIMYQAGGKTITKQSSTGTSSSSKLSIGGGITFSSSESKYKINDKITILYNPNNAEEFIIEGEQNEGFIMGIIFIVLGAITAIFGTIKPVY